MGELSYGVKLETMKSIKALEDWLKKNCRGRWGVDLDGFSDDLKKKKVVVLFDSEEEKNEFKSAYGKIDTLR